MNQPIAFRAAARYVFTMSFLSTFRARSLVHRQHFNQTTLKAANHCMKLEITPLIEVTDPNFWTRNRRNQSKTMHFAHDPPIRECITDPLMIALSRDHSPAQAACA